MGLETHTIVEFLNRLSKTAVQPEIIDVIRRGTSTYGKVRLAVKHNRYFVESSDVEALQTLLKDDVIRDARVMPDAADGDALQRSQVHVTSVAIEGVQKETPAATTEELTDDALLAAAESAAGPAQGG